MRLLLVEDTDDLALALRQHFSAQSHAVDWARDGREAIEFIGLNSYDVVLLDLGVPEVSGTEFLKRLRNQRGATVPVLVITARSGIDDKIKHLDLGADDYLCKPFDLRELDSRLGAVLRRHHGMATATATFGNFVFDGTAKRVTIAGTKVDLGRREFRLLEYLISTRGRITSKEDLLDRLFSAEEEVSPNAVELYVSRLRRKLEGSDLTIRTVRGLGYVVEADIA